jgi:hypothetical protein
MVEAASASETSVKFNQITRHNIPEDSHLHINWDLILWFIVAFINTSRITGNCTEQIPY